MADSMHGSQGTSEMASDEAGEPDGIGIQEMAAHSKTRTRIPSGPTGTPSPAPGKQSRDERLVNEAMAEFDASREAALLELARQVREGTYSRSGSQIAEAIINERLEEREEGA